MIKKSARRIRRTQTPAFKARVARAALCEVKTMAQLCQEFEPHAIQITKWKRQIGSASCWRMPLSATTQPGRIRSWIAARQISPAWR